MSVTLLQTFPRWKIGIWSRWSQFKISCYEVKMSTLDCKSYVGCGKKSCSDRCSSTCIGPVLDLYLCCAAEDTRHLRKFSLESSRARKSFDHKPWCRLKKFQAALRYGWKASKGQSLVRVVVASIVKESIVFSPQNMWSSAIWNKPC